ncbi:NAD(P)-dependent oxidoreductase [Alkalicoccus chagannorensis]|uniref:NAD(P)-dependent oxidoreductase n=1 Tax=Alkalicoccus chagannorensis TaxID=427072 RepID=UPI000687E60B|nr:NAD(P)-dependent oxidoreductase [Alkalicoccus chagannorensis]
MYPIPLSIDLNQKPVTVIGGGPVAERRTSLLLEAGASITVISPELTETLASYDEEGRIAVQRRTAETADAQGMFLLVLAADQATNEKLADAAPDHALVNDAAEAGRGNVQIPAILRRGRLAVSVSTNGASPGYARHLLKQMTKRIGPDTEDYLDFLFEARELIKQSGLPQEARRRELEELMDEGYRHPGVQKRWLERWRSSR